MSGLLMMTYSYPDLCFQLVRALRLCKRAQLRSEDTTRLPFC